MKSVAPIHPDSLDPPLIGPVQDTAVKTMQERLEDAMREVGTLLIAFAPLDAALTERPGRTGLLLLFMAVGVLLFIVSVLIERRRSRVQ